MANCIINFIKDTTDTVSGMPDPIIIYNGTSGNYATVTIPSRTPTRSGYTFKHWSNSSGGSRYVTPGNTYSSSFKYGSTYNIYAVWEKNATTYTLSYNANGGTGAPSSHSGSSTSGSVTLYIKSGTPSLSGYTFVGWASSSSATIAEYTSGDPITLTSNRTIYAVWKAYAYLDFNSNNTGSVYNMPTRQSAYGVRGYTAAFTFPSQVPTCTGYSFKWWSTTSTGAKHFTPGNTYNVSYGSTLTAYAIWDRTYTIGVAYYNGSSSTMGTVSGGGTGITGTSVSISASAKTGYRFVGWYYSSTGTEQYSSSASTTYTIGSANQTLYAKFVSNTFSLSLGYVTGSSGHVTLTGGGTYNYNSTATATATPAQHYDFDGWYTNTSGTSRITTANPYSFTITSNTTLCAKVIQHTYTYKLTFNANGGSGAPSAQSYSSVGTSHTFYWDGTVPTRTSAYQFLGWSFDSTASTPSYTSTLDQIILYSNNPSRTLYAVWKPLINYTINYSANGGTGAPGQSTSGFISNDSWTTTVSSIVPTKGTDSFQSWSGSNGNTYQPNSSITLYKAQSSVTLTAQWAPTYIYHLDYNTAGGTPTIASERFPSSGRTTNTQAQFSVTNITPSKDDYDFLYWLSDGTTYGPGDSIIVKSTDDNQTRVLTAQYQQKQHWVQASLESGSSGLGTVSGGGQGIAGSTITITATPIETADFIGWYDSGGGTGTKVSEDRIWSVTVTTSNQTYYARFRTKPTYTVTYNSNGGTGTISSQTKYHNINLQLSDGTGFTRSGSKLNYWNTQSDGSGTDYALSATYTLNANLTLYAIWETTQEQTFELRCYLSNVPRYQHTVEIYASESNHVTIVLYTQLSDPLTTYLSIAQALESGGYDYYHSASASGTWSMWWDVKPIASAYYDIVDGNYKIGLKARAVTSDYITFSDSAITDTVTKTQGEDLYAIYTATDYQLNHTFTLPVLADYEQYTFEGWSSNPYSTVQYTRTITIGHHDYTVWGSNYFRKDIYSIWSKKPNKFCWYNNDTIDIENITTGKRAIIPANGWNWLVSLANAYGRLTATNLKFHQYIRTGMTLTASNSNYMRNGLLTFDSSLPSPPSVSQGDIVYASYFQSNSSLKSMMNTLIYRLPSRTLSIGNIISMNLSMIGKTTEIHNDPCNFRILDINGNIAKVFGVFGHYRPSEETIDECALRIYNNLPNQIKNAISATTINDYNYTYDINVFSANHCSYANYATKSIRNTRNAYLYCLDIEDIENYFGGIFNGRNLQDFSNSFTNIMSQRRWLLRSYVDSTNSKWGIEYLTHISPSTNAITIQSLAENEYDAVFAFTIDLSQVFWV